VNTKQKEAWWARVQRVEDRIISEDERQRLSDMLQSGAMVKALGIVLSEVNNAAASMLSTNLGSPEGISSALREQGSASGIVRAVEVLAELAMDTKDQGED
jgi:hypothetical protein